MSGLSTWSPSPQYPANYNDPSNWSANVPGPTDTAEFEASTATNMSLVDFIKVGHWLFNPGATQYNFDIAGTASLSFEGSGIAINSGSVHILDFGQLSFEGNSTAGAAAI